MRASCIFLVHPTHTCTHTLRAELHTQFSRELPFHLSSQKLTNMWQAPLAYLVLLHSSFIYPHADFLCWNFLLYKWCAMYSTLCCMITPHLSHIEMAVIAAITSPFTLCGPHVWLGTNQSGQQRLQRLCWSSPHQTFSFIAHKHEPSHFSSSYSLFVAHLTPVWMAQTSEFQLAGTNSDWTVWHYSLRKDIIQWGADTGIGKDMNF